MNQEQFLIEFQKYRSENGYPKRDECRNILRKYKELYKSINWDEYNSKPDDCPECIYYILQQNKPSKFLDSLFSKENSVCKSDPKQNIRPESKKTDEDYKLEIINAFYSYVKENKSIPQFKVLNSILEYKAQKYFHNEKDLYYACSCVYDIKEYCLNECDFSSKYTKETLELVKKYKRFLVSTAVSGKRVNSLLLKSMLNYCERNDALILVLPSQDVFNRKSQFEFQLDPLLRNDRIRVVYEDLWLNSNVMLSDIKVSAKMVNGLQGLDHLCKYATTIIGNCKQDMRIVANSPNRIPNAIMLTGALTEPDFQNDAYMSDRLNKLAIEDFVSGAIVVNVESDKIFHYRQVQMGSQGEIIDLGERYWPDGKWDLVNGSVVIYGDIHGEDINFSVLDKEREITQQVGGRIAVLHDIMSCRSISHHNLDKFALMAQFAENNKISLEEEVNKCSAVLEYIANKVDNVVIVDSNHHRHLESYLNSGKFIQDKANTRYAVDAFTAMVDGEKLPLRYLLNNKSDLQDYAKDKIKWLEPNEEFSMYGCELWHHGDRSSGGSKGNALQAYHKAHKASFSAHKHQPSIYRSAYCVGLSAKMFLGYNFGLSGWLNGLGVLYPNGSRQLINIIEHDGNYTWRA